jgi:hypothetical protein
LFDPDADGNYEGTYNDFWVEGRYTLFFYAMDTGGLISPFKRTFVYKSAAGNTSPGVFDLQYPADGGQIDAKAGVGFTWQTAVDPDVDSVVTYTLEVCEGAVFDEENIYYLEEGIEKNLVYVPIEKAVFENGFVYSWRVVAIDQYGAEQISSAVWTFEVNNLNPFIGWIEGMIYDAQTKAGVPNAQMNAPGLTLSATDTGYYLGLGTGGVYDITIAASGYASKTYNDVVVPEGGLVWHEFTLNALSPEAFGNVDGDQDVDLADAVLALQVVAGLNPAGVQSNADVNGDGKIGMQEVAYILQKVAGLR